MSDVPNNPYNPYPQGNPYAGGPAKYCSSCGAGLVAAAVICPNCGSPAGAGFGGKSKTAAVLLAVFLGPWTWLYTYRRNAWKFWAGLAGGVVGFVVAVVILAGFGVSTANQCINTFQYQSCQNSVSLPAIGIFFVVVGYLIPFAVWIWAIVDVSVTPPTFYQRFPNG